MESPEPPAGRSLVVAGALNLALAVAAGAFGAHGLRDRLPPDLLATWQTGAHYHLAHGLGMLAVAALLPRLAPRPGALAGWLLFAGIVLFSGSLYALALTGARVLGAVAPLGGACFLAGWCLLAVAARGR